MLYFGMNLPSSLMRSARTIGLVAGGAAGGPGGMAVGAMAASAGGFGRCQRPQLGGFDGDPIGGRWRRRGGSEERRRVTTTPTERGRGPAPNDNKTKEVGAMCR